MAVFPFLFHRLVSLIPVCFGVVTLVSMMIYFIPGDPVDHILGDFATLEAKHALKTQLGLDLPVWQQVFLYIKGLFYGDMGQSIIYNRPVMTLILERFPGTMALAFLSLLIAVGMSLPLGILAATHKGKLLDQVAMAIALVGVAMPNFWLGPMLILLFSLSLNLLPVSGTDQWTSYILPSLTMGTSLAAILSRMTRNSFLDCLTEDYVRTAKAKGASNLRVVAKHVFRNAMLPVVTLLGLQFGVLLTGAIVTEKIFDWPGLGSLILEALGNRDYPLVQGCVLVFAVIYVFVNLLTDVLYKVIDPRISFK